MRRGMLVFGTIFILLQPFFPVCSAAPPDVTNSPGEPRENCRLLGIQFRTPWLDFPEPELLASFASPTHPQPNGWSLAFYSDYSSGGYLGIPGAPLVVRSERNVESDQAVYHAVTDLALRMHPDIIIGHLRTASSGCYWIADPHPFRADCRGRSILFIHNGGVWGDDLDAVAARVAEYGRYPANCPDRPIDSEYLFLLLCAQFDKPYRNITQTIEAWMDELIAMLRNNWNAVNVIITDGRGIWAVRYSRHRRAFPLRYRPLAGETGYVISTDTLDGEWMDIPNHKLVVFKNGTAPDTIPLPEPSLAEWNPQ